MFYSLKKNIHCVDIQEDIALLYYFGNRYVVKGAFVQNVLEKFIELLQKPHTLEQILEFFVDSSENDIKDILNAFMQYGLLEQIDSINVDTVEKNLHQSSVVGSFLNYFMSSNSSLHTLEILKKSKILIVDLVDFGEVLVKKLSENNLNAEIVNYHSVDNLQEYINRKTKEFQENTIIIACSWMNARELQKINALFLNLKIKWLLVVQDYFGGTIGPLLGVKDGPCFNCLMKRKYSNMPRVDMYLKLEEYFDNAKLAESSILLIQEGLANKVGIEIFKVMTNIVYPKVYRGLYEFDILNHRSEYHEVLATPFCEVCSRVQKTPPIAITSEV